MLYIMYYVVHIYIYMYVYLSLSLYIYIYIYIWPVARWPPPSLGVRRSAGGIGKGRRPHLD